MRAGTYIRIVVMVLGLIGVLWTIRHMNAGSMEKAFEAMGLQAGGAGSPGFQAAGKPLQPGEERFNLCPTRIVTFQWTEKYGGPRYAVEERQAPAGLKMQWWAVDQQPRELNYLEIETWLTSHCQIAVKPVTEKEIAIYSSRVPLELHYVDKSKLNIEEIDRQFFRIGERYYESHDFAEALKELRAIAQFGSPVIEVPAKVAPQDP